MLFDLFKKNKKDPERIDEAPSPTETSSPPEAAITAWCRKNRSWSGTAKLFYDLADRGMPLFQTDAEAVSWLSERAGSDPSAATVLGLMHDYGLGIQQSDEEAIRLYRFAADHGLAAAQYSLGVIYYNGQGIPQSDQEALKWFKLAADQGDTSALRNLGLMYADGRGVTQSFEEAVRLYRIAADQGIARRNTVSASCTPTAGECPSPTRRPCVCGD